ncbi:hypothetical protein T484DRAFT_1845657 [Baffinella frigidus]|nr:hypothetical protein T484DRAFT_1845657 [Cryptophyta sp. CCMP2293]
MCVALSSDLRPVKPGYVTTTAGERYALVVRAINEQNTISKLARYALVVGGIDEQNTISKLAVNGQGVDRHLLALNKVAQGVTPLSPPLSFGDPSKSPAMFTDEAFGNPSKSPAMFTDEAFAFSQTWMMSTSNVTTPWNVIFNFGPVADDGYGLGYLVHEDELIVNVTSWSHSKVSDAVAMSEAIQEAAHILRATVEKGEEMKGSAK